MFCKLVVSTEPSQGIYGANRSRLLILQLFSGWDPTTDFWTTCCLECSLSNIFPPCQRIKPPAGKSHVTNPVNKMNTCTHLATVITQRIQTLYRKEACQTFTHIDCQVQILYSQLFDCLGRDLNYGTWPVTMPPPSPGCSNILHIHAVRTQNLTFRPHWYQICKWFNKLCGGLQSINSVQREVTKQSAFPTTTDTELKYGNMRNNCEDIPSKLANGAYEGICLQKNYGCPWLSVVSLQS
jgi:hypothetical protein